MSALKIVPLLASAFDELFTRDCILFDLGAEGISEQTATFRLGYYLQNRFPYHNVDCEYNRWFDEPKRDERVDLEWMKPDVIIHTRRTQSENLIVIEAKKGLRWDAGWADIEQKLQAFTRTGGRYEYRLGVAWRIAESQNPEEHEAVWFFHGGNCAELD